MRHAGHWKGSMVSKYVVEIETETGHAAFRTDEVASAECCNATLYVMLRAGARISYTYRSAEHAGAAYRKIADAIRSVA